MRLLRVIPSISPATGGPIEALIQMQQGLGRLGIFLDVVSCDDPNSIYVKNTVLKRVNAVGPSQLGTYGFTPKLQPWLNENISAYDAMIVDGLWQYHSYSARKIAIIYQIPYFVYSHGMLDPYFNKAYPLKYFKKLLYWLLVERFVLKDAKAVIFTCEDEKLFARKSFVPYKANEAVSEFGYGLSDPPANGDHLAWQFLQKNPSLHNKRIVLFLSRIHEKKGCDLLLEAFARIVGGDEGLHLAMAGPDQNGWVEALKERAIVLGIDHKITWLGMLQGEDKWGAFYACEVFCLPSHQENFGIVVAEALGCGKPVLISDKVNIWHEIEVSQAGFVDEDTIEGTVLNLNRWLSLSKNEYDQMALRAKECFSDRFHIDKAANRLVEIICENTNNC
ncbi:transferase [Polynucleobacter wuianus]|uniref:Transferase n=2 Tax=Burkholderiaceae TaxID=119060 RepID=A0A191UFJ7_9BURK|nr:MULTISPECIES: glycosyltransferase [Polynucleobacter]ANI99681.1 transferase [Polynucleobacter wuianus]MBU3553927.1 glycosyltransferase [Polynucleobacter sp. MWH-Post4-6-1]MBU3611232.1 glycosyltransferase [Polynucleobacter wuianus]